MKRKSLSKYLFITLFVALTMGCITACRESDTPKGDIEALSAPEYITAEFWEATWQEVEKACGYTVYLPDLDLEIETQDAKLSLFEYFSPDEEYYIRIKANGDGIVYADSEWKEIEYQTESVTEGLTYQRRDDGTYMVACPLESVPKNGKVVFPDKYNARDITGIYRKSSDYYASYASLSAVRLPSKINGVGAGALSNTNITEIYLPDSVEYINKQAFKGSKKLKSVVFSKNLKEIEAGAFMDCLSLEKIDLPEGLEKIHIRAFLRAGVLEIDMPDSLTYLEGGEMLGAFQDTPWLENQPDGVIYCGDFLYGYKGDMPENTILNELSPFKKIANYAFRRQAKNYPTQREGYTELTELTLPEGCTVIGKEAFMGCTNLKRVVLPNGLMEIGQDAFKDCINLSEVNFPDSLTHIKSSAFCGCSLTQIYLSNNLIELGSWTFKGCKFNEVQIPSSLSEIKGSVFSDCTNLTKVIIPPNITECQLSSFSGCIGIKIIVPDTIAAFNASKPVSRGPSLEIGGYTDFSFEDYQFDIYFLGDKAKWESVASEYIAEYIYLNIYFYSEEQPDEEGKFWHYDTDGNPVVWA